VCVHHEQKDHSPIGALFGSKFLAQNVSGQQQKRAAEEAAEAEDVSPSVRGGEPKFQLASPVTLSVCATPLQSGPTPNIALAEDQEAHEQQHFRWSAPTRVLLFDKLILVQFWREAGRPTQSLGAVSLFALLFWAP